MILHIAGVFLSSVFLALFLTPLAREAGKYFKIVDLPSARKVHSALTPRDGGIAVFLSFFLSLLGSKWILGMPETADGNSTFVWLIAGGVLVFALGLVDDIRRLPPHIKFAFQIIAALLAYAGGTEITQLELPAGYVIQMGVFSLPLTVLWFLLVINAVNLIDGLDGLAAGVTLFASLVLLVLSSMGGHYWECMGLAGLAGACLGFLRYNFNPASIFLGDSGSYFIGYTLASLSLLGSMKSEATVAILIPVVALGLPLIDTILAPVRRFIIGKRLFRPDSSHIHHKLLQMGLTQRKAVLLLYAATITLGLFSLALVRVRNELHAYILLMLAITVFIFIRKLGYLHYVHMDKVMCYFRDVADEMGLNKERRTFLNQQIAINDARSCTEMWDRVVDALQFLQFDYAEIYLVPVHQGPASGNGNGKTNRRPQTDANGHQSTRVNGKQPAARAWHGTGLDVDADMDDDKFLTINLPLISSGKSYGRLILKKNLMRDWNSHYTLRRVEHLRRSIVRKLKEFDGDVPMADPPLRPEQIAKFGLDAPTAGSALQYSSKTQ